jgi:M6 family metalloprotease-like protein
MRSSASSSLLGLGLLIASLASTVIAAASLSSGEPSGPCSPSPAVAGATEGASIPDTVARPAGVLRAAQVLVDFPDAPAQYPVSQHLGVFGPADDWFKAVSYGRLSLSVTSTSRWLRLPLRSAEYQSAAEQLLADAVAAADDEIDFSKIDVVYIVPTEGADYSLTFAVLNGFGVHADGVAIKFWVPFGNGFGRNSTYPGGLVHETGHLLGLPDLYQVRRFRTFHFWDVMTDRWPSELLAWHRWKLGWLDTDQIVCIVKPSTTTVTLTPIEKAGGPKAVIVHHGRQILVAEVRQRIGYDAGRCDQGVLIYAVDTTPFKRGPVKLYAAHPEPPRTACGPAWQPLFDLGPREVATFRLPAWRLRIDLVAKAADGSYRLRVIQLKP